MSIAHDLETFGIHLRLLLQRGNPAEMREAAPDVSDCLEDITERVRGLEAAAMRENHV
ncbi:MAG: hypothetical protein LBD82_07360 [Deltaproteobacteria bacterium]|jgi:hypothetical protein|nr:hypothetical protein [Deltaproteobacteria bacterium]